MNKTPPPISRARLDKAVTFFEKKVTKKTFAGGLLRRRCPFSAPGGGAEGTPAPQQPARKSFLRAFFQKSASFFLPPSPPSQAADESKISRKLAPSLRSCAKPAAITPKRKEVAILRLLAALTLLGTFCACSATAITMRGPAPPADWLSAPLASLELAFGQNPSPVRLLRPQAAPLSPLAQLGKDIFFDQNLSASRKLSCASCHSPQNAYTPVDTAPAEYGGPAMADQGARAVPSLMYLETQPPFSIGPDPSDGADDPVPLPQLAALAATAPRAQKTADSTAASAINIVPQGGLFWDGRADTLPDQAIGPLQNPIEMDGGSIPAIAAKLLAAPYAQNFAASFPPGYTANPETLVSDAVIAIARYETEDPSFHPYASKYDAWLEGKARFTPAEMRGYVLFNDPRKGDCGACHLDQPGPNGEPPLFTDHQFEALGIPRNPNLAANQNPAYFDLGICGPYRKDLAAQTQYCGMFLTPTLRNVARKNVFFHNGIYHSLTQVLDFYNFRDTEPAKIYPTDAAGHVQKFNDLPPADWPNIDTADPPFDRQLGQSPPLTPAEEQDIIAFLKTLSDR